MAVRRGWWIVAILALGLAVVFAGRLGFAHATDDGAAGRFDPYLHRVDGQIADPVNLIFRGSVVQAAAAVQQVLGWQPVQGSAMTFFDRGQRLPTAAQFGHDLGGGSRYHIRLEAVRTANGRVYVLAGVHRDDMTACGHVGHVFNTARDLTASAFAGAGYRVASVRLGNTEPGRQCDGTLSAGDGTASLIDLGQPPQTRLSGGPLLPLAPRAQ